MKNSDCSWTQNIENIHQFHHRSQIHLKTVPCIAVSFPKHCRLVWQVENNHLIKLNELIDHHITCYIRLETITFHRNITQHDTTNQVENDGRIPECLDTAVWIFLSSSPGWKITYKCWPLPQLSFICYLAAPWPILGHYQEDSLTHPMLITSFLSFFVSEVNGNLITMSF